MDEERMDEAAETRERKPLDAGHDAPSHPWRSAEEVRGDLDEAADERTDPDALPQTGRRREPGADVAVEDDAGRKPGEEQPTRDTGQEAGSVSEPG